MNTFKEKFSSSHIIALVFVTQLLTACVPGTFFNSGIAKEWAKDESITREQLIMEPSYYFSHLNKDMDRITWMMIPKGKLLRDANTRLEFMEMRALLRGYVRTLDELPGGKQLPERQLAAIYIDLLDDFDDYLENNKTMGDINAQLSAIEPQVKALEIALHDADSRRLSTLVQTISGSSL